MGTPRAGPPVVPLACGCGVWCGWVGMGWTEFKSPASGSIVNCQSKHNPPFPKNHSSERLDEKIRPATPRGLREFGTSPQPKVFTPRPQPRFLR